MKRKTIYVPGFWAELPDEIMVCDLSIFVEFDAFEVNVISLSTDEVRIINESADYKRRPPLAGDLVAIREYVESLGSEYLYDELGKMGCRAPRDEPFGVR